MGIKSRIAGLVFGVALASGAMFAGTAGAAAPINGVGTVSCSTTATVTYKPALKASNTGSTTVTLKSKLFGCTGTGDGANVTGGTSTASHVSSTNDCTSVLTGPPSANSGPLKWKTAAHTPKLTTSTITLTGTGSDTGPPVTNDAAGSSTAGSFSGDTATAHSVLKETSDQITAKCLSKGGLKTLHVVTPGSNFVLSSGT